ncbi:MAG: hypothetical protein BAJALOKI3v1_90069 [Promethearchaeota archaeon]|jgi:hypothetical protein|nr:MAG: hypothetical protein BAJALOKI3v1_90069 [Candidatus Lokiarchaeota archaeon]
MSLERRRDTKEQKNGTVLEESSFRETDFTPLVSKEEKILIGELSEIEKEVLEVAEDILKLKRYDTEFEVESQAKIQKYPIIEKLYATCIAKLAYNKGYSKEDLFLAIRSLEEKNWIVTNERRTKLEILSNDKLSAILDFIGENPGIHARDEKIEEELGITRTPFLKHIMTLENFELIRSKKIGKTLHYFLKDVPEDYDKFKALFLNPLIPQIIEELFRDESIAISTIAEKLDVYPGTINYHLNKMKKMDLIKSSKNNEGKKIHIANIDLLKQYNSIFKEPNFSELLKGL